MKGTERAKDTVLIHLMHFPVYSLGPGTRVGVWFQGCTLRCPGCVTPESWSFDPKTSVPVCGIIDRLRDFLATPPYPDGLTISGGEPFDQPDALLGLLRGARELGVSDVLAYSGYRAEALLGTYPELALLLSALVDGPFELGNRTDSVWKGSENQRLTLLKDEFSERYAAWVRTPKRKMQLIGMDGSRKLLIGIPRQEDASRLKNPFSDDCNGGKPPWN